ncbi:MAG: response regulator transcription factor [Spirochaetes bacterium]|nr:response regulator transcription factor [Spirochaetota bacterium]
MLISEKKKQFNSLLLQLSNQLGQEGFLEHITTQYKKIMSLQHIHFIHLNKNGELFFEEINGPYDTNTFISYQHEDVWIPKNSELPLPCIINKRIDKQTCLSYADNANLYNWLLFNQKCYDILGTIHPCLTAFVCFRLGENQLNEDEYQFHVAASNQIINLYYLDRRIKLGNIIEDIFKEERHRMMKYPLLIMDRNFQVIYDENNFGSELKYCKMNLTEILYGIKNTILFSKPTINGFRESYELVIYNKRDSIKILILPIINTRSINYLCYLKISATQSTLFTKRELEIVNLIEMGLSNKEIADRLYISTETVKKHIYNMMTKTRVKNRISLVKHYQHQLL